MKAEIINPVNIHAIEDSIKSMYLAAKTCTSAGSPIEMNEQLYLPENQDKDLTKLIERVVSAGHESILEHTQVTFAIEGISRACSHQLVRHRHATFSQQSQRYVEIKENPIELKKALDSLLFANELDTDGDYIKSYNYLKEIIEKYFIVPQPDENTLQDYGRCLLHYLTNTENGMKPEDARMILPNATKTNLVMSCNLRELKHIMNFRLCSRAQKEIRDLAKLMKDETVSRFPFMDKFLVAKCAICQEKNKCEGKPNN